MKLCYVFWRKFDEAKIEEADTRFNQQCMELISAGTYKLAEGLLSFSRTVPKLSDITHRMMIVNLANSIRLQDRIEEARRLLDTEDWSAANDEFQICVASVKGDLEKVLELMCILGGRFKADDFRTWPVFRRTRSDPRFLEKFEAIYGEPFILSKIDMEAKSVENADTDVGVEKSITVH